MFGIDEVEVMRAIQDSPDKVGLLLVAVVAASEYLIPMLPADTVLLGGALLVVADKEPFAAVWAAAVVGGAGGGTAQHLIGTWLRGGRSWLSRWIKEEDLERVLRRLEENAPLFMTINRALPGVRGLAFIAAGFSGMSLSRALLFGMISQAVWAGAILGLGVWVGDNWDRFQQLFTSYQRLLLAVAVVIVLGWVLVRRWKRTDSSC
jgi:membrane protein DedA with SNARE-associated domain